MQMRVDDDALLIYHNAAFAKMVNCLNGTQHIQNGMGKRTHLAQLNAAARQVICNCCLVILPLRQEEWHAQTANKPWAGAMPGILDFVTRQHSSDGDLNSHGFR